MSFKTNAILMLLLMGCSDSKRSVRDPWEGSVQEIIRAHREFGAGIFDPVGNCIFERSVELMLDSMVTASQTQFDSLLIRNCYYQYGGLSFSLVADLRTDQVNAVELSDIFNLRFNLDTLYGKMAPLDFEFFEIDNRSLQNFLSRLGALESLSDGKLTMYVLALVRNLYRTGSTLNEFYFEDRVYLKREFQFLISEEYNEDLSRNRYTSWLFGEAELEKNNLLIFEFSKVGYVMFYYSLNDGKLYLREYFVPHKVVSRSLLVDSQLESMDSLVLACKKEFTY